MDFNNACLYIYNPEKPFCVMTTLSFDTANQLAEDFTVGEIPSHPIYVEVGERSVEGLRAFQERIDGILHPPKPPMDPIMPTTTGNTMTTGQGLVGITPSDVAVNAVYVMKLRFAGLIDMEIAAGNDSTIIESLRTLCNDVVALM